MNVTRPITGALNFHSFLCVALSSLLDIFGLKVLVPLHWKLFRDVNVLFILSNCNYTDQIWKYSIVLQSYCATSFFPLLMYRLCQVPYKQIFLLVMKVNIRAHVILYINYHIYIYFWHKHERMNEQLRLCKNKLAF